jgi:hypothetical protein
MKPLSAEVLESLGFTIIKGNEHVYEIEAVGDLFYVYKDSGKSNFTVVFNAGHESIDFEGYEYEHQIESLISALKPQSNKINTKKG